MNLKFLRIMPGRSLVFFGRGIAQCHYNDVVLSRLDVAANSSDLA